MPRYSIIVPVYNRPQEVDELLASLTSQTFTDFEVLIIEDGSTIPCDKVFELYTHQLAIRYFFKPNSGPGPSRNFGYQQARGEYFIVFDSDCIVPPNYLESVEKFLRKTPLDAWGGPDRGHEDFTTLQRAMAFTMSSVITTGGIRGGAKKLTDYQPRSFNMGITRKVFQQTGGFKFDRFAEDIEFSIRMAKGGYTVGYIPDAFVYHKRRTNLKQFYKQVYNFGRGRVMVSRKHPEAVKLTHWFPTIFSSGMVIIILLLPFHWTLGATLAGLYVTYFFTVIILAYLSLRSIPVAIVAGPAAFIQLVGYGYGFLKEKLKGSR